jgi:hypothetical protein
LWLVVVVAALELQGLVQVEVVGLEGLEPVLL